jgi:hypothetical protein
MAKETYYTLLVNGEPKRLNEDLQRLKGMATDFIREGNVLTIRCPQSGGSGGRAALLTYDTAKGVWSGPK